MKKDAFLFKELPEKKVHCYLCAHQCKIADTKFGVCGVRQNLDGRLYTHVYGDVIVSNVDPIEKKPLHHFYPGTTSYSIAAPGCNFRCGFCQNWRISQLRKEEISSQNRPVMTPDEVVENAVLNDCQSISYTYTEPTIFFEFAHDVALRAKKKGLSNVFVTNGYMSKEAVELIHPYLDAANVDLKSFRDEFYQKVCHGHLQPVLETIHVMKELGIWVEVTTLIIPGKNDSVQELTDIASFLASEGRDIPWHVTRFHPDYEFLDVTPTSLKILQKAYDIGEREGLRYVYIGNTPFLNNNINNTVCSQCHTLLIKRSYMAVDENKIADGKCPSCGAIIDGRF